MVKNQIGEQPLRCVMIGEESLLVQCGVIWRELGQEIMAVVSRSAAIVSWAQAEGIPVFSFDKQLKANLEPLAFDYLFSIANLRVIKGDVLSLAEKGAINFHDGPLPKYAGLYTTSWAIYNQEKEHGITWHRMTAEIDAGEILGQKMFDLAADETAFSLNVKCYEAGIETFGVLARGLIADQIVARPQDLSQERYYYGRFDRPAEAFSLNELFVQEGTAEKLDAWVRACSFGGTYNPFALPKLFLGDHNEKAVAVAVPELQILPQYSSQPAGTILDISEQGLTLSSETYDILLPTLRPIGGELSSSISDLFDSADIKIGLRLPNPKGIELQKRQLFLQGKIARHESWWRERLTRFDDLGVPYGLSGAVPSDTRDLAAMLESYGHRSQSLSSVGAFALDELLKLVAAFLLRLSERSAGEVALMCQDVTNRQWDASAYVPLALATQETVGQTLLSVEKEIKQAQKHQSFYLDLAYRDPELTPLREAGNSLPHSIVLGHLDAILPGSAAALRIAVSEETQTVSWRYDTAVYTPEMIELMQRQLLAFITDVTDPAGLDRPFPHAALLSEAEKRAMLTDWNETAADIPDGCIHDLFAQQVAQTPEATALVFGDDRLTYRQLDEKSNQMAHFLAAQGVTAETVVGIYMGRGIDMMIALYGVLKAGGAYLPLDPDYPADRLAFMIEDTETPLLLTETAWRGRMPVHQAQVVAVDGDWDQIGAYPTTPLGGIATPENLSYIIYTSGSTGKPKGVMLEHRNVVNFFIGMDQHIPHQAGDVWLAVTSLSFDISVLELFWTLCRGLTVVLYGGGEEKSAASQHARPLDFSLFYFSSDEGGAGATDKYRLLLDGAKFADQHGFKAIWTPERHFHAFGGLYPNPAVTSAALAAITERIDIRAGSCVLPLHHPARVAEEWSVVDNLSNGRVGISFAAGWQPDDFIFQPENYAERQDVMWQNIEVVRGLWRGETVLYDGGNGAVEVRTLPRPVQSELPTWITAAGNPETFRRTGENGYNMLTHLLGQTIDELAEKIAIYRQARRDAGHEGDGKVSILLHTLIGDDLDQVKALVREPMTDYLRSSLFLIRRAAWSFPTFQQKADESGRTALDVFEQDELSSEEMDALLAHSFERYFADSSLLGTPEKVMKTLDALKAAGVDEVACQIDFGVADEVALAHLPDLDRVRQLANQSQPKRLSIPELIVKYDVTHFQCTPSMMSMLLLDEEQASAYGRLQVCLLGGEALSQTLAAAVLGRLDGRGRLLNMYGPTETTIWSAVCEVPTADEAVPVGRPIANTDLYVVDEFDQPLPIGLPGELLIGGDGVARGYLKRPELTAERFVSNRFRGDGSRVYRTGDMVRYRPDGMLDFLGRIDHQVKLRGYRIELGEIEARLRDVTEIRDAVVILREDVPGDKRLVAYLVFNESGGTADGSALRQTLLEHLPDFMVPAHFVALDAFPLTPNKKTDRKALPAPDQMVRVDTSAEMFEPPAVGMQAQLAEIWQDALRVPQIGIQDNFFAVGGHSILAVQVHRRIREELQVKFSIADMFRYATIASLSAFLGDQEQAHEETKRVASDRAQKRRGAMGVEKRRRRRR